MPLMSNVMCPRTERPLPLARVAVGVLPVQLGGGVIARQAGRRCFMPVLSVIGRRSSCKVGRAPLFAGSQSSHEQWSRFPSAPSARVRSGTGGIAVAAWLAALFLFGSAVVGAAGPLRLGAAANAVLRSGVAAAEQAPACWPVLVSSERLPPLQNASMRRPAHNPSIERTVVGKPPTAAHVER